MTRAMTDRADGRPLGVRGWNGRDVATHHGGSCIPIRSALW
jgi:hypothetical protein